MLIDVPICGLFLPFLFFGVKFSDGFEIIRHNFYITLIYVIVYWFGVRKIIIGFRKKYPNFKDSQKRIISQLLSAFVYAVIMKWVLHFLINGFLNAVPNFAFRESTHMQTLSAIYMVLFLMLAVYESIYLYDQLRISVQEQEKVKQEHLRSELQGLRNQVNPHFLFNSLNTLMNIIPKDSDLAVQFLHRMSNVYRYILESREEQIIPLKEELEFVHSYVFLLKERFKNKLEVQIEIPAAYLNHKVLPLSLQLLLENAIKHNVVSKSKPLLIEIQVIDDHFLMIRNNFQAKKQVMDSTKVGLENIRKRYQFFTDKKIRVEQTVDFFTVFIPLIPNDKSTNLAIQKLSENERSLV